MATKPTKVLMDEFFESPEYCSRKTMRSLIDRNELYRYEEIINKQFFDMSVDDLIGLIKYFAEIKADKNGNIAINLSSNQFLSLCRSMFNWYIDNEEIIKNPFNNVRLKSRNVEKVLSEYHETVTWDTIQNIIGFIRRDYDQNRADYIECLIHLFYCGFSNVEEIVLLTKKDIDFRNRSVRLRGRTCPLTERCYELLIKVHSMESMPGERGDYLMLTWRDYYFKYPIRPSREFDFDDRECKEVSAILTRHISEYINKKYKTKLNHDTLFYLGFYNYIVEKIGEARAREIITSYRVSKDTNQLMELADAYGINPDSVFRLKGKLKMYVELN